MNKQQVILTKLERQLTKLMGLIAKTEQQADLAFCEKEAKTITVILKALETLRGMQKTTNDAQQKIDDIENNDATDHKFRTQITQKLAAINKK